MNTYKEGLDSNDEEKLKKIQLAVKCLDLSDLSPLIRKDKGKEIAIFLKETIDRIYVPRKDYSDIPESQGEIPIVVRWVIPDTEITILLQDNSEYNSEFRFSSETVLQAFEFYSKTKHLPYLKNSGKGAGYSGSWKENFLPEWMKESILGLEIWLWIGTVISLITGIFLKYLTNLLFYGILKLSQKFDTEWNGKIYQLFSKNGTYMVPIAYWFITLYASGIEGNAFLIFNIILKILVGFIFIGFVSNLSDFIIEIYKERRSKTPDPIEDQFIPLIAKTLKILLVSLGILLSIQNLGINVISLLAGLGIGGLALALAAKDTAANLFGSLMIYLDRPFKIDDHIIMGGVEGRVEEIGLRSTRVRTWNDSLVSIPNSIVANSNIDNMGLRRMRRTNTYLSITYDTSPIKIEAFLEGIKNILKRNEYVVQERIVVGFQNFGDSGLIIQMHFYLNVPEWNMEMHTKEKIFMEIITLAAAIGVSFAFPTSTLHIETFPEKKPNKSSNELEFQEFLEKVKEFSEGGLLAKPNGQGIYKPRYKEIQETPTQGQVKNV
ncbi:MAG: mechanosensitive ion channel family protein [Leptospiraceae bacterium]|nr:mechanosensitive ion channel family protein [Leptospiraceae bacterium]MCP5512495.1 mechanosensitive ion channel family protein [Leptospiraceae bacterium]